MKVKRSVFIAFLAACVLWALMPAAFAEETAGAEAEPAGEAGVTGPAEPENDFIPEDAPNGGETADAPQDGADSAAAAPPAAAGAEDAGGETEEESVIYISDLTSLETFRDRVNGGDSCAGKTVVLTADIDMSASYSEGAASWTPIGNSSNYFKGTFDGGGHTVSGLYINAAGSDYQGLFGILGEGGEIKNLGVGGAVTGKNCTGAVCGDNYSGRIENCYNTGVVSGAYYVGGVCGFNNGGTIMNCYNTGAVSGTGDNIGGVCSFNYGNLINCYNTGAVSGTGSYIGGVCGENFSGTVENCYYIDTCGAAGLGTSMTAAQSTSGRAAWLLQNGRDAQVWGQTIGTDSYPVLGGKTVYQVTFKEDGKDDAVRYCNAGGFSDLPYITARDGYTARWQTQDGAEFTAGTAVSGDIVLTAAWIADAVVTPEPASTATPQPEPTATPRPESTGTPPRPETTAAPRTGDGSAPGLWLAMLALAGAGLTGAAIRGRRKKKP